MGVWIETYNTSYWTQKIASHPAWVCGLKHKRRQRDSGTYRVTPCVGVWIETSLALIPIALKTVTPCVGVWIETSLIMSILDLWFTSHPAWVCGLKLYCEGKTNVPIRHTLRGCVDWNRGEREKGIEKGCHTLRGCVDWNWLFDMVNNPVKSHPAWVCGLKLSTPNIIDASIIVTPCVGVWIET